MLSLLATLAVERLERFTTLSEPFMVRAADAVEEARGSRELTPHEAERIADLVVTASMRSILLSERVPSKGALRDEARAAGASAVAEVIGGDRGSL